MPDPIDKKALAQQQRESIAVVSQDTKDEVEEKAPENEEIEKEDEEKAKEENEEIVKEDKEKDEKEDEEVEENDEDEEIEAKEEDDPVKLKKTIERLKKRVGKTIDEKKQIAKDLAIAQTKLEAKKAEGDEVLTEADIEKRAEELAEQRQLQKEFDDSCERLSQEALKIDKTFNEKVTELGEDYGKIPPVMIAILDEIPRGGAVLNYLCDNPDEYEILRKLGDGKTLKAGKLAAKLKDISDKLKPKKEVKAISKTPPPNKPIKPSNNSDVIIHSPNDSMDDFVRKRNEQTARRRQMGR